MEEGKREVCLPSCPREVGAEGLGLPPGSEPPAFRNTCSTGSSISGSLPLSSRPSSVTSKLLAWRRWLLTLPCISDHMVRCIAYFTWTKLTWEGEVILPWQRRWLPSFVFTGFSVNIRFYVFWIILSLCTVNRVSHRAWSQRSWVKCPPISTPQLSSWVTLRKSKYFFFLLWIEEMN